MDEDQFDVHLGQSRGKSVDRCGAARRVPSERACFKICHESRDVRSRSKRERIFLHIHLTVVACPGIDSAQPDLMNTGDIGCRKLVILIVGCREFFERAYLFASFELIHLSLAGDAAQVL